MNNTKDLEFRYFDSDGDGYLDTTQVFLGQIPFRSASAGFTMFVAAL